MRYGLALYLYGSLALIGGFLFSFWLRAAIRRFRIVTGVQQRLARDRAFILAAAICTTALGDAVVFTGRVIGNFIHGETAILRDPLDGALILAGLAAVMLGNYAIVWLADLEHQPPIWTWTRWLLSGSALWAIVLAALFSTGQL